MGNVRFLETLILGKVAPKYMSAGPRASITLTSGTAAHRPVPGGTVISGWVAAVESVARGLAVELAPIRVNFVCLGAVQTELLESLMTAENREATLQRFRGS